MSLDGEYEESKGDIGSIQDQVIYKNVLQTDDQQRLSTIHEVGTAVGFSAFNTDCYTQQLENLYTSCLEWIISRAPSSLNENIVIDECDKVGYQPAI